MSVCRTGSPDRSRTPALQLAAAGISLAFATACNAILGISEGRLVCQSPDCSATPAEAAAAAETAADGVADGLDLSDPDRAEQASSVDEGSSGNLPLSGNAANGAASSSPASNAPVISDPVSSSGSSGGVGGSAAGELSSDSGAPAGSGTETQAPATAAGPPPVPAAPPSPAPMLGPPVGADGLALPLPNDLIDAPVSGEIVYSDDAQWEVNGVFQPTFEIHTPTASYWIVKPLGSMVSMQDSASSPAQWVDFSSGFRPLRGVPSFAEAPSTRVTTLRDQDSQTPTHVRLLSESQDQLWQWVWDFYITHVTFTLNRAPGAFGFGYRGVPGGSLGNEDRLVTSDGVAQGARNSFEADLPGPVEWVYFADTSLQRSLFLLQHGDDDLPEHYQVRDNDSADWLFGGGELQRLPMRFSLGLLPSSEHAAVAARVRFVASVIH